MTEAHGPARPTGAGGERRTGEQAQAVETALEAADAAARSGSPETGVPDDEISRAAARVGADRGETTGTGGTNADAPASTEPEAGRTITDEGDPGRRE
jgi:hypothetical protein